MDILKLTLTISIMGVFLLFLISLTLSPKEINTSFNLTQNQYVKINAIVVDEKNYNGFKILTLKDNFGKIKAICNCRQNLSNKQVEVIGKITLWQNEKEIEIEKIKEND